MLVHGLGSSSRYWEPISVRLAGDYQLIIPDLLGFGDSAKPYVTYGPALHCQAIEAVLADVGVDSPFAIVGHSLGAVLSVILAGRPAVAPRTAVLITPPFPAGPGLMREEVRRRSPVDRFLLSCVPVTRLTHVGMRAVWPAVCTIRPPGALFSSDLLAEYGKYTFHSYMSTLNRCLFDYDLRPSLNRLGSLPTLVLRGTRDRRVPAYHGASLAAHLANARLETLPSRHHPVLSHGAALAERLRVWLDQHQ